MGNQSKLALFAVAIPLLLLVTTGVVVGDLSHGLGIWQPPHEFWQEGPPPPPEWVGRTLGGTRLYHPFWVLALARFWSRVAAFSLLVWLGCFLFIQYFRRLIRNGSFEAAIGLSKGVMPVLYTGLFLFPIHLAEFVAAIYFWDTLTNGGPMFLTPAAAIMAFAAGAIYLVRFRGNRDFEAPPVRLPGKLTSLELQPRLFETVRDAAAAVGGSPPDRLVLDLRPVFSSAIGKVQCDGEAVDGHTMLIPVTLVAALTAEEFRCLCGQSSLQVALLHPLPEPLAAVVGGVGQMVIRMAESGRVAFLVPGMGLALSLYQRASHGQAQAILFESDRITAAKLGSLDLVRGMLKAEVMIRLWQPFLTKMGADLKAGPRNPDDDPYRSLPAAFVGHVRQSDVSAILSLMGSQRVPGSVTDRLARLGYAEKEGWPALDFAPDVPAAEWIANFEDLDRALSTAERSRFVFERR